MSYLWLLIGILPLILIGWLLLRVVEGKTPVLGALERVVAGFIVGCVAVPYAWFLVDWTTIGSFGFVSILVVQIVMIAVLFSVYKLVNSKWLIVNRAQLPITNYQLLFTTIQNWNLYQKLLAALLTLWFITKMIAQWILLIGPAYFDDTVKNWNLRAKAFYEFHTYVFDLVPGTASELSSYPPTVSLVKTWLVSLNGGWHEGLANGIHMLWFLAALVLLYCVLRRVVSGTWALVGTYVLSSIPLYALHGGIAYADQFLSVVVFLAVSWLYLGVRNDEHSFLRISAVVTGLMIFTKNEALLLYLPPMGLLVLLLLLIKKQISTALWYAVSVLVVGLPWLLFKWSNSLTFGNAKSITGFELTWHEKVLSSIFHNTFFMGHWSLLPVIFVTLVILKWKTIARTPLLLPAAYFGIVWLLQICVFVFTPLATEAIMQTGYARGIIHLVPLVVLIVIVCLSRSEVRSQR